MLSNVGPTTRLLVFLSTLFYGATVLAEHFECWWRPHDGSPVHQNYNLFCIADYVDEGYSKGHYKCRHNQHIQPANFGHLRPEILEVSTPCGGKGWALDDQGKCIGRRWAACLGDSSQGKCYYLESKDDCEWPEVFGSKELPSYMEFWVTA